MISIPRLPLTAIILAAVLIGGPTLAQDRATPAVGMQFSQATPPAAPGWGPGAGRGSGMMGGGPGMMGGYWNVAGYLDSLKAQLRITEAQEPAWKAYAGTVCAAGDRRRAVQQAMFQAMATNSWQQRQEAMSQMFQSWQQAFSSVHDAATKLLAALDPAQKADAQRILPGLGYYGPGMMGCGW